MAEQSTKIDGPVHVVSDSPQRVALDLLRLIDGYSNLKREEKDKKYWLTLYRQCHKAVNGHKLESILTEE